MLQAMRRSLRPRRICVVRFHCKAWNYQNCSTFLVSVSTTTTTTAAVCRIVVLCCCISCYRCVSFGRIFLGSLPAAQRRQDCCLEARASATGPRRHDHGKAVRAKRGGSPVWLYRIILFRIAPQYQKKSRPAQALINRGYTLSSLVNTPVVTGVYPSPPPINALGFAVQKVRHSHGSSIFRRVSY